MNNELEKLPRIELLESMLLQRKRLKEDPNIAIDKYTDAQWYCANAYEFSRRVESAILIFHEVCWEYFIPAISGLLLKNKVDTFCLACPSTNLMDELKAFQDLGWEMFEVIKVPICTLPDGGYLYGHGVQMVHELN